MRVSLGRSSSATPDGQPMAPKEPEAKRQLMTLQELEALLRANKESRMQAQTH